MMVALLHSNWQLRTRKDGDTEKGCQKPAVQQKLMMSNYDLSPTFSKINGDFCQKINFLHTLCIQHLRSGCLPLQIYNGVLRAFHAIPALDRWTDGRTDIPYQSRVSVRWRAIKTESRLTKCTRSLWLSSISVFPSEQSFDLLTQFYHVSYFECPTLFVLEWWLALTWWHAALLITPL